MGEKNTEELVKIYESKLRKNDDSFKNGLSEKQSEFIDKIEGNRVSTNSGLYEQIWDDFKRGKYSKPSHFIEDKLLWLFNGYIPERFKEALYYSVDCSIKWSYSSSYYRRSFRYPIYEADRVFRIIYEFHRRLRIDKDTKDILTLKLEEDERAFFERARDWYQGGMSEYVIAYELDRENKKVEEAVEDILNGDSEIPMQRYLIRGIIKSKNKRMHELLGKLLLAARLQEGLRQSICEEMDTGIISAFLTILRVINDNNLIRFSSVKRAVGTWLGLINADTKALERISDKSLELITACLENRSCAKEYIGSRDCMKIYTGLWSVAVYNAHEAIELVKKISETGTHHQILTAGYFCANLDHSSLAHELACKVILQHRDEQDILAVYMGYFLPSLSHGFYGVDRTEEEKEYDAENLCNKDAVQYYGLMKYICQNISGKGEKFSPCIFPWYEAELRKTTVIEKLCRIAVYLGEQEKIDEVCELLKECEADNRARCVRFLLRKPSTLVQKRTVTAMLCDRETYTRQVALEIVQSMKIEEENFLQMEEMLRYKAADMRSALIALLYQQKEERLLETTRRLLKDRKEEKRTAGLDIVMRLSKDAGRKAVYEEAVTLVAGMTDTTPKEQVLISSILGMRPEEGNKDKKELYQKTDEYVPVFEEGEFLKKSVEIFMKYFPDSQIECQIYQQKSKGIFDFLPKIIKQTKKSCEEAKADCESLVSLFREHSHDEYRSFTGEVCTFSTAHWTFTEALEDGKREVPGIRLWKAWYEEKIASPERLYRMYVLLRAPGRGRDFDDEIRPYISQIFGDGFEEFYPCEFTNQIEEILQRLIQEYIDDKEYCLLSAAVAGWYVKCLPQEMVLVKALPPRDARGWSRQREAHFITQSQLSRLFGRLNCRNNEYFKEVFPLSILVAKKTFAREPETEENSAGYYFRNSKNMVKSPYSYWREDGTYGEPSTIPHILAACQGLISREAMYEYMFRECNLHESLEVVTLIASGFREINRQVTRRGSYGGWRDSRRQHLMREFMEDEKAQKFVDEVYEEVVGEVLSVELTRGDSETKYSGEISSIRRIYGINNFVRILTALGKDTLDRTGCFSNKTGKKASMSHLLSVCIPYETDTADRLREELDKIEIKEKRLIEAALYSPEWIDIVGEYLGFSGFKSVCYYFMAHMNESFDDIRKAVIAKYTPLSQEQLNDGAFDVNWFKAGYEEIGERQFELIYDAAKYISDGAKHARARKYADAVLGKMEQEEVEEKIADKRNKDLVMAYSLIPLHNEDDIIRRYLYLQNFLKESRKYGSQRIASEKKAAEISLSNLAMNAGYSDVTRLTLRMETKLMDDIRPLLEENQAEDVTVELHIDENGKADIICRKEGRNLKSVPARLKKNPYIMHLNENKKKLNDQYKRTKLMFEQAMEEETEFTVEEIGILHNNPVAKAVVKKLVFVCNGKTGFLTEGKLTDYADCEVTLSDCDKVKVAHPFHIYKEGHWSEYQKVLFDRQMVQPFKQVFRELYVKTEDEFEMNITRRYSGNQIQPQKTVACLKGRRWVADVEDGLQKVYYEENIVARIYAMADWFSPSDIEAPTLEWVEFSDRRTGKEIKIKDIPDVIFSEVMRDVDLAVSVAHAGGVDPQTSHSTVEMRAALLSLLLPLLKLDNVEVNKNHAVVKGHYGTYDINLGSGIIHKSGGSMIAVLPVHSQHRGRIFLPFADDDPKTAEIITKVIMFAEDKKIKDVSILEQVK